jgi:hypothetical protein
MLILNLILCCSYVYVYCDNVTSPDEGESKFDFEAKHWCPPSTGLQALAERLKVRLIL